MLTDARIRKIYRQVYSRKNIELIGISTETDDETISGREEENENTNFKRFVAVLKHEITFIPVGIHDNATDEEIRNRFDHQLRQYGIVV